MSLENIRLGYTPLTDSIYLYRHGKDKNTALEKREAERDVMAVLVEHMMEDAPNGSEKEIQFGDKRYLVRVTPIDK